MNSVTENLHRIRRLADECRECLEAGEIDGIGVLLDEGWQFKQRLAKGITNGRIAECYSVARESGALGGKITGAGGGGFLLLYSHENYQEQVTLALEHLGLRRMDFHFETQGVTAGAVAWSSREQQSWSEATSASQ